MRLPVFMLLLCLTAGCSQQDDTLLPQPATPPVPLDPVSLKSEVHIPDGTYVLRTLNSQPYSGPDVTLRISGSRINGKGPVNAFHANLLQGRISPVASTRMAGDPNAMELETTIFGFLEEASLGMTDYGELAVRQDGIARLIFLRSEN